MTTDIPPIVTDDAKPVEQLEGEPPIDALEGIAAVDYDGGRYCLECANPEYVELALKDPYAIPYGGPVPLDHEVDCPGHSCDRCHRMIPRQTLLHYEGVCNPDWCPEAE